MTSKALLLWSTGNTYLELANDQNMGEKIGWLEMQWPSPGAGTRRPIPASDPPCAGRTAPDTASQLLLSSLQGHSEPQRQARPSAT